MKKIIILLILVVYSCETSPIITIQLVETTTKSGICFAHGSKEITIKKTETSLGDADFKIALKLMTDSDHYIAMKRVSCCLEMCPSNEEEAILVITDLYIVVQNKEPKQFISSNEFLDFMSAGNYEIVDEVISKGQTEYTFKQIMP